MGTRSIDQTLGDRSCRGSLLALAAAASLALLLAAGPVPWVASVMAAGEAFPVTVADDEGTEVVIEAEPERIIGLSPAIIETVFALGAGDRLVGGTESDDYPAEAGDLPDVASFTGVVMEQVVALEPDLVLAAGNNLTKPDEIARMRELGFPVVVIYAPDVPSVLADIELIGAVIGESDAASEITAQMSADLEAISAAAAATGSTPRTFYELDVETEIYAPAPDSFHADMIVLAGGDPITTSDPALWSIPLEELIVADPEVIVLGDAIYGTCPDAVAARPGWDAMTAVLNGDIRPVNDVPVTRPGPRLAEGLASLARAIQPGLDLAGFPPDPPMCEAA